MTIKLAKLEGKEFRPTSVYIYNGNQREEEWFGGLLRKGNRFSFFYRPFSIEKLKSEFWERENTSIEFRRIIEMLESDSDLWVDLTYVGLEEDE